MSKLFLASILTVFASGLYGQVPTINDVEPKSGYPGEIIAIKGSSFNTSARVFFGTAEAVVVDAVDNLIEVAVPAGATFDYITVLNPDGSIGYSNSKFLLSYGGDAGISSGSFSTRQDFPAESGLYDVCLCDLDGDGLNDLIASNSNSNDVTLYLNSSNNGALSLPAKTDLSLPGGNRSLNVTCGDLTGDGLPEMIISDSDDGAELFVYTNFSTPGSLSFTIIVINLPGLSTKRIAINDLDDDGKADIVVTDQLQGQIAILRNTSGGSFSVASEVVINVANASSTAALAIADMNGDGKPDIITSQFVTNSGGYYILLNRSSVGNIQFSPSEQFPVDGTLINLLTADLNNDGLQDLIATRFLTDDIAIYLNSTTSIGGVPTFEDAAMFAGNDEPWGLDIGDIDGDGDEDIVISNVGDDLAVTILENQTTSSLAFQTLSIATEFINRNIEVGDVNADGKPDIIYTSVDDNNNGIPASVISILLNEKCINPIITPEEPLSFCDGNISQLETQSLPGANYEWFQDGVSVKNGSDNFYLPSVSGDYSVTISSDSCIESSATVEVTIGGASSLAAAVIDPIDPICTGGTLNLSVSDVGATSYEWQGPNGYTGTGITPAPVTDFDISKTGKYTVEIYDGACLAQTVEVIVDIIAAPTFSVSSSTTNTINCEGTSVTLTVSPDNADFEFQWFDENGAISGATGLTFNPTTTGSYYAEAYDQVNTSCPAIETNTIDLTFYQTPNAQFSAPANACVGSTVTFTNESTVDNNATVSYSWNFGDGTTSSQENTTNVFNSEGSYEVTLEIAYSGVAGCTSAQSETITVSGNITPVIEADKTELCPGESIELSLDNAFESYEWSTGATTSTLLVEEAGIYSVEVIDDVGCDGTASINITIVNPPVVEISSDRNNIAPGTPVQLEATGLVNFAWSPEEVLDDASIRNPVATVGETTLIEVNGADENGCTGAANFELIVRLEGIADLINPKKYFTPNPEDNINATWEIENIEQFQQCGVKIYDQIGNIVLEATPYNNDWDGTSSGNVLPEGVYYYVIQCDEIGTIKSGSITLLR